MIQMIGCDLDGTLLNDQKAICPENIRAVKEAIRQGLRVVLCSGRSPDGMKRELSALSLNEFSETIQYAAGLNGGVIFETATGKILNRNFMDPNSAQTMLKTGREMIDRVNLQLYDGEHVYVENWDETTDFYHKATGSVPIKVEDLLPYCQKAVKIVYFLRRESKDKPYDTDLNRISKIKKELMKVLPETMSCAITAPYLVEVFDEKTNKGAGMRYLSELVGIKPENVLCIGDLENDKPMIEFAGIGAVMCNGSDDMKQAADYVTKKNNNDGGVAEVLERFVLK